MRTYGIHRQLIELAELKGNEKILDVGCGPGNLDLMVAGILGEGSIYGIDIAPKMIETARKKAKGRGYDIDYRVGILHGLYPPELAEENGFYTEKEINGPSFLKSHHTNYRVLTRNSIP